MTAFWISLLGLIVLIILGMPIAFSIGIASVSFVLMTNPLNLIIVPLRMFSGVNSFTLHHYPFFKCALSEFKEARLNETYALVISS